MKYIAPKSVELTIEEQKLFSRIPVDPSHDEWPEVADAMELLIRSLLKRDAVPVIRLRLFDDAEFAETGKRSPCELLASHGMAGSEIYRSPHFIEYLRYFIEGPKLPKAVVNGLVAIMNEDRGTSGMVMTQYRQFARAAIRDNRLPRRDAATEFFRLGVEIGMSLSAARTLRDAAMSTR